MKHELTAHDLVHLGDAKVGDCVQLANGVSVIAQEVTITDLEKSRCCCSCEFELLLNEDKPCRVNCLRDGSYGVRFVMVEDRGCLRR